MRYRVAKLRVRGLSLPSETLYARSFIDTLSKRSSNGSCRICSSAASKFVAVWILGNPVDDQSSGRLRLGSGGGVLPTTRTSRLLMFKLSDGETLGGGVLPIVVASRTLILKFSDGDISGDGVTIEFFSPALLISKLPCTLRPGERVPWNCPSLSLLRMKLEGESGSPGGVKSYSCP